MEANLANTNLFSEIVPVEHFDTSEIEKARKRFIYYVNIGVIQDTGFNDDIWSYDDEYNRLTMTFDIQEFLYAKFYQSIFGITPDTMKLYVKCYITHLLGQNVLTTIRDTLNDILEFFRTNPENLDGITFRRPSVLFDFIELLPVVDEDTMDTILTQIEICTEMALLVGSSKQRELSSFETYFLLNDILNEFWEGDISEEERLFFYPLYLWWRITSILPLRPREFILTPRNCLSTSKGKTFLTIRRNNLKGSNRRVQYNISSDYRLEKYEIPNKLYAIIQDYIDKTSMYDANNVDTLFRAEAHYKRFHHKKPYTSRFYTYVNLACCLRLFYSDIISKKLGYTVRRLRETPYSQETEHEKTTQLTLLTKKEIEFVHLADTRHVAMISFILQGGTPAMAMLLAGHADITISSHYYSNISKLIECQTYSMYQKQLGRGEQMVLGRNFKALNIERLEYIPLDGNGKCYSKSFLNGEYTDCVKAAGDNGEIGYCYLCPYYRNSDSKFYAKADDLYRKRIDTDSKLLKLAIKNYRKGLGYSEDIHEALIKLQSSSSSYQDFWLQNKYFNEEGETAHGTH